MRKCSYFRLQTVYLFLLTFVQKSRRHFHSDVLKFYIYVDGWPQVTDIKSSTFTGFLVTPAQF